MPVPTAEEQVQFLVRVQRLLDEGVFVATYRYALLTALADLSVERGGDDGEPIRIATTELAEKFILSYWRQVVPYVGSIGPTDTADLPLAAEKVLPYPGRGARAGAGAGAGAALAGKRLRQNTGRQAAVIKTVADAHARFDGSIHRLRSRPREWRALVSRVAATVRVMPLWKLQTIGGEDLEFLYPNARSGSAIELRGDAVFCLRRFHALVTDLVQAAWVRFVRRLPKNRAVLGDVADLREFLFGSERQSLEKLQPILTDMQSRRCFYCERDLRDAGAVDHFIPWARYPLDLGHNFVLAHTKYNGDKSDHLTASIRSTTRSRLRRRSGDAPARSAPLTTRSGGNLEASSTSARATSHVWC